MRQNKTTPAIDKAIPAIDLKGAFDNVRHGSILVKLSKMECGHKAVAYVRDLLSKRRAVLKIADNE